MFVFLIFGYPESGNCLPDLAAAAAVRIELKQQTNVLPDGLKPNL
jgi:hypothetical protein